MIAQIVAAFIATVAFSVIYHTPKKYYLFCGITGAAGWLLYCLLTGPAGIAITMATFFSTMLIVFLSRIFAVIQSCPATVFIIAGIFPLVPGSRVYWAAYYFVINSGAQALDSAIAAVKLMFAMVLGIVFVTQIPQKFFGLFRKRA